VKDPREEIKWCEISVPSKWNQPRSLVPKKYNVIPALMENEESSKAANLGGTAEDNYLVPLYYERGFFYLLGNCFPNKQKCSAGTHLVRPPRAENFASEILSCIMVSVSKDLLTT